MRLAQCNHCHRINGLKYLGKYRRWLCDHPAKDWTRISTIDGFGWKEWDKGEDWEE